MHVVKVYFIKSTQYQNIIEIIKNKKYLPNTRIHAFELLRPDTRKKNIILYKKKNTFEIRVFMYLGYPEHGQMK